MGVPTVPWGAVTCAKALFHPCSCLDQTAGVGRGPGKPLSCWFQLQRPGEHFPALTQPGAARCVVQLWGVLSGGKDEDGWSRVMGEPQAGQDTGGDGRAEG